MGVMKRLILFTVVLLFVPSLWAGEVRIKSAEIMEENPSLVYMHLILEDLFFPSLKECLLEGVPLRVKSRLKIEKERNILWDSTIWKGEYTRELRYNVLTKSYEIKDPLEKIRAYADFDAFSKAAQEFLLPIPEKLLKEQGVYLVIKVYRKSVNLFFPLNLFYSLLSSPPADFHTQTYRIEVDK